MNPIVSTRTEITVAHHGIAYVGELFRTAVWDSSFGLPLDGDVYFRIVFLDDCLEVFPNLLHDHRIAIYVPGPPSAELEQSHLELKRIRESLDLYGQGTPIFDLPYTEHEEVQQMAIGIWTDSLSEGALITTSSLEVNLENIFGDGYWTAWGARIGKLLLERAYANPSIRKELLRTPIQSREDAPVLYDGLIGDEHPSASFAMETFASALGLFAFEQTQKPSVMSAKITRMTNNRIQPYNIGVELAHGNGLTYPIAILYAIRWLFDGDHRIDLKPTHNLLQRDGKPYKKEFITSDDVANLRWPEGLWGKIEAFQIGD